jgi:hypothetical protein
MSVDEARGLLDLSKSDTPHNRTALLVQLLKSL